MSNGNLPNVPQSWFDFVAKILLIIAALTGLVNTVGNFWNNRKIETGAQKLAEVRETQTETVSKIDKIEEKTKVIDKKAGEIKTAVEK